ncbi:general negative regulator of transcription subunit 3 isoform X2 [Selaginella moellendorffii]|uniref:general negative regulator of transcription subunit 3 isoform X2 n=1 Tax=Selaginella moellendorffii TaxID=88036 RepID=UPI000D1CC5A9|nr:general negative regulator of transcription subunit 3 isoform X2 [Selaginella moellendorffii]|eukprot:XP_024530988.1 general negative regulator of transcription subunit 3 isoform X2 [Selaginella moellendorffii]
MGATRKLQGEIDRVLKKVQEGVDVFDSIWNKVYDTENANQKEKFEADLKKEIKKLQRYRDQIKTWIQSSEIKDKKVAASYEQALVDARKLIEREMERFKVCEKETKTKAFSKEGLGQLPKTDPKEKAKAETREWLNNMVDELNSGIDAFETEMEGLAVKKGKTRPPRLIHLEESTARHKSHVMKLELILRLLDNDELSPEQVNDVKELVEDYLERNQEDFDEFADVDELYSQLPLDKMEAMEALDLAPNVASALVVKEKAAVAAASGASVTNGASVKPSLPVAAAAAAAAAAAVAAQVPPPLQPVDDITLEDTSARTSPVPITASSLSPTGSALLQTTGSDVTSSPSASGITQRTVATPPGLIPRPTAKGAVLQSSPAKVKEDEVTSLAGRRVGPGIGDGGLSRSFGRQTAVPASPVAQPSPTVSSSPTVPEAAKRNIADDRATSGVAPQLSPLSTPNKAPFGGKVGDSSPTSEAPGTPETAIGNRLGQWRESSQFHGRPEIVPDQKQKFLQKLQQANQQTQHLPPHLTSPVQKQTPQPSSLLHQALLQQQQQQQLSPLSTQSPTTPVPGLSAPVSQAQSPAQPLQQQPQVTAASKDAVPQPDAIQTRTVEQQSPLAAKLADDNTTEANVPFPRNLSLSEDDLKNADTFDVGGPGTLAELSQLSRDADFTPGQQVPSTPTSSVPGVIGRKSNTELGAIGDNLSAASSSMAHDSVYNLQMLEAAYRHLPLPKDSERPRNYTPRNPAITPPSYPQAPAQSIIDNPALWEKFEVDVLFYAFYYHQGTYQQYLAARELKKHSWRYHKKYNTWFQRHEEPKVTTDEFEQGTYVYFDFHIVDDIQQGWVQRIKTEFTFEYSFLEDELV